MSRSTGLVLAAGGIAAANELIFAPVPPGDKPLDSFNHFNWSLVPATLVLALTLTGLEKATPGFAVGLAGLTLLAILIVPVGKAPSPLENVVTTLGL